MTLGKFVIGRVIKAMQANWHPDCFRCEICNEALADSGFVKNAGRYVFLNVLSQGCVLAESSGLWALTFAFGQPGNIGTFHLEFKVYC